MKKDFIMEDGRITRCEHNMAQMNLFQILRYFGTGFHIDWGEYFEAIGIVLFVPVLFIFFPIIVPVYAIIRRNKARKDVKRWEEEAKEERG